MKADSLEFLIGQKLQERGLCFAAAESCTGGLIGHRVTNIPGASAYYLGSVTAYANEAKVRLLGVRQDTLDAYGAVSEQTVREMAQGIRHALEADIGISVSGIAGPGGGTPEKPVGLVWIGLAAQDRTWAQEHHFHGERGAVKGQAAEAALGMVLAYLEDALDGES